MVPSLPVPLVLSAYVPCCNNRSTVRAAVESLVRQTAPPDEILVIDDGSTDDSVAQLAGLPVRVVRHARNLGRGAVRATAMREARGELVLSLDATNRLPEDFVARARPWFDFPHTAAVFGPICDPQPAGAVARWRARHVFQQGSVAPDPLPGALLATYGTVVRAAAVSRVGGYNPALRHSEDGELGRRLLAAGEGVIFVPELTTFCNVRNSLSAVLERYARWRAGAGEGSGLRTWWAGARYAWRAMLPQDLRAGDPAAAAISLVAPFFHLWHNLGSLRR